MKLLVILFFLSPITFALLDPILDHPQHMFFINVKDHVSHQYQTTDIIIVLYILIFMFADSKQEAKDSVLNFFMHPFLIRQCHSQTS